MKRFISICLISLLCILFFSIIAPFPSCQLSYAGEDDEVITHTASPDGLTEIWKIALPNVKQHETAYQRIIFRKAEKIRIEAGGCVQTGGSGKTWKRYVNPSGPNSDRYYFGLIKINGVTNGLERISKYVNRSITINQDAFLSLGYMDNKYSDNGYYSPDDGTENQCKGEYSAYVKITVTNLASRMDSFVNPNFKIVSPANATVIGCSHPICTPIIVKWTYKNLPKPPCQTVKMTVKELDAATPQVISKIPLGQNGNGQYALSGLRASDSFQSQKHYFIKVECEQAPGVSSQIDINLQNFRTTTPVQGYSPPCTNEDRNLKRHGCRW